MQLSLFLHDLIKLSEGLKTGSEQFFVPLGFLCVKFQCYFVQVEENVYR